MLAALVAFAPLAVGAPTPVCGAECRIEQNSFAYMPPVFVVPDGGSVVFASLDTSHVTVGSSGIGGGLGCFLAVSEPGDDPDPVVFDVDAGALYATTPGMGRQLCADAVAMPAGGMALPYHCMLHTPMRGALVVTPT